MMILWDFIEKKMLNDKLIDWENNLKIRSQLKLVMVVVFNLHIRT